MGLDIRIPIGAMFSILGLLLVVFGALANSEIYKKSLEINVNLWWGVVMLVFGVLMAYFGKRADRRAGEQTPSQSKSRR
jgi:hypothetical protein